MARPDGAPADQTPAEGDAARVPAQDSADDGILLAGVHLLLDPAGALYWPEERLLVVADLHLEKGSAFAARGVPLPPYDSRATLALLERIAARWQPRAIVALGDSFHDRGAAARLGSDERASLAALGRGREMIWIAGNHDPDPAPELGGNHLDLLRLGPLTLRHEPAPGFVRGEIVGHFHPVARLVQRGRSLRRRCFATDGSRLVMPALGAYAGGLNIRDAALAGLFVRDYAAHLVGAARTYRIAHHACLPDRAG
ncbi:ligase-associated DNA damage response endonuclease PdeM [Starkeya sp. 3C]|uniref:Ligase-associated DNA damage response endonuclease PdeM n=1 Tax=Ancylobacter moscoviensis TaxID=2597768 RepID=A0ABY3DWX3_9HYPH|nr:ligase-associated DNA damage response endonuclease PdeM [Ancylobacter moscoviensis]TSJ64670.1 ligase-associated DNA damage response endonuclease PdeM [Ancylobacter moscoviensis]